jgi:uncharacterized protein (DUF58 family)
MLIIALVLAVIGLAALVFAVVTSNELIAWVCIGASVLGVVLLIIDALQERQRREASVPAREPAGTDDSEPHRGEVSPDYEQASSSTDNVAHHADYPEDVSDEDHDDASPIADTGIEAGSSAEYEHGGVVRDDHNSR